VPQDRLHVLLHGAHRNTEHLGDLPVSSAVRQQDEHLALPRRELAVRLEGCHAQEGAAAQQQLVSQPARADELPGERAPQRSQQRIRRKVAGEQPPSAGFEHRQPAGERGSGGQAQAGDLRVSGSDRSQQGELGIKVGVQAEHHDVRSELADSRQHLAGRSRHGLGHDLGLLAQPLAEATGIERLRIDQEDAHQVPPRGATSGNLSQHCQPPGEPARPRPTSSAREALSPGLAPPAPAQHPSRREDPCFWQHPASSPEPGTGQRSA